MSTHSQCEKPHSATAAGIAGGEPEEETAAGRGRGWRGRREGSRTGDRGRGGRVLRHPQAAAGCEVSRRCGPSATISEKTAAATKAERRTRGREVAEPRFVLEDFEGVAGGDDGVGSPLVVDGKASCGGGTDLQIDLDVEPNRNRL
ncbi:hypothetical protein GW17_00021539 [Ensete ventricosum]|nr:hypothetical protein GW17_00021539 [Ensete ventricosum]